MCFVCRMYYCPPECPEYEGVSPTRGRPTGTCDECGRYIYDGDPSFSKGKATLCARCAAELWLEGQRGIKEKKGRNDAKRRDKQGAKGAD